MGGSQLKALKASLKSHGLIGQTNTKGKGKGSKKVNDRNRQDKEKVLSNIRDAFSPFDVKKSKQKVDVIGRKVQGATGKPGISKQIGEENRRSALLAQMAAKNRVGGLMDRRFGENDPSMNPEEKMLERFTRERQMRASKGNLFSLEDEDDTYADGMGGGDILTHGGQALSLADDFDEGDLGISDEDEESKRELAEIAKKRKRLAEGGEPSEDEEEPKVKKSRDEVMKEIIAKSKFYKHERQMAKMEDQNEIDKLDDKEAFDELMGGLREAGSFGNRDAPQVADKDEEYEQQVRMFAFDRRARPADRTKTEDEIAKEKAEKLQKLERKRLARMNGEEVSESDSSSSSDESEVEDDREQPEYGDHDDEINDAEAFGFAASASKTSKSGDEDDEGVEDIEGNYAIDEEFQDFASEGEDEDQEEVASKKPAAKKSKSTKSTAYTFECPEDLSDLTEIFSQYPVSEQPVIVDRILTLYHPSLNKDNKEKISAFTNILAEYILQAGNTKTEGKDDVAAVLDKLIAQLKKLSEKYNESLSEFLRQKLTEAENTLLASIESVKSKQKMTCHSPSYLFLFTLVGILFSTSDHFHQIVTPATLLMGQHLSQHKVNSLGDILAGLYLSSTLLSYQRISKRYIPEVVQFLAKSIALLAPIPAVALPKDILVLQGEYEDISSPKFRKFATTAKDLKSKQAMKPLALRDILDLQSPSKRDTQVSAQLYVQTCALVSSFTSLWSDKLALVEMFGPFVNGPLTFDTNSKQTASLASRIEKVVKFSQQARVPLTLQAHRPIPIASNVPKFEENYSVDKKSYDPDQTRQEISKLKAAVKKERKGALRELRKDNQFVAREKIRNRREADSAYHEKMARLVRTVATEEGAEKNKYEREKAARKRKSKN